MAEVNISINGRSFGIACDDGQERRVIELAQFVDSRVKEMAAAGAGANDSHLLVLASIVMADELFTLRDQKTNVPSAMPNNPQPDKPLSGIQITREDETAICRTIEDLGSRIEALTGSLQKVA